jgi:DNA-binding NtrC family response regulator
VLVVDDAPDDANALGEIFASMGIDVVSVDSTEKALALVERDKIDLVVADLGLPGASGIELTRTLRARNLVMPIVMVSGSESVAHVVEALKVGASDYLPKPVPPDHLKSLIHDLLTEVGSSSGGSMLSDSDASTPIGPMFEGMIGPSTAMQEVFARIARVAPTSAPVLIIGESGTGKELVAQALHNQSRRKAGPFVAMHTGAIPRELVASELFGHEKGAFTGAMCSSEGRFAAAERGTLFLDEVGTMDIPTQISLLRVLETYRYNRVGAARERTADVRIVAATNTDLLGEVQRGHFREDLFYRLNVLTIRLPALRERLEDIVPLAESFLTAASERFEVAPKTLSSEVMAALQAYSWPGNVRELRNAMDQVAVFAKGDVITPNDLELGRARLGSARLTDVGVPMPEPAEIETATCEGPQPAFHADAAVAAAPTIPEVAGGVGEEPSAPPRVSTSPAPLEHVPRDTLEKGDEDEHRMVVRVTIGTSLAEVEKLVVLRTLEAAGGNKQRTARILGISRRGLYVKLESYGEHDSTSEG